MTTYYVATLAKYVLVEAENEEQAASWAEWASTSFTPTPGAKSARTCPSIFSSCGQPRLTRSNSADGAKRCSLETER
jgi:hypothetical protein